MSKRIIIILAALLVFALALPAAANNTPDDELQALFEKLLEIKKQIIDRYVAAGQLTPEQGEYMKDRMDATYQFRAKNGFGPGFGPRYGYGGGMMGGWREPAGFRGTGIWGGGFQTSNSVAW